MHSMVDVHCSWRVAYGLCNGCNSSIAKMSPKLVECAGVLVVKVFVSQLTLHKEKYCQLQWLQDLLLHYIFAL